MTSVEDIEQFVKPYLLKEITFSIDNKALKSGKLILFSIKDFFCVFTLAAPDRDCKRVIYEIPYPFTVCKTVSSLEFNYTLDSFCLDNKKIAEAAKRHDLSRTSKIFNKRVVVIPN